MNTVPLQSPYLFLLLSNCMMMYGVWNNHWPPFLVIYAFWLETVILSFFSSAKILFAKGEGETPPHVWEAIKFLAFRLGMLLFYSIFLVVFLAFQHTEKEDMTKIALSIAFKDSLFNFIITSYIFACLYTFIFEYWLGGQRERHGHAYFFNWLDARTIVIHLVIVLGTFIFSYTKSNFAEDGPFYGKIGFLLLFVVIKTIADFVSYSLSEQGETKQNQNYNI